MAKVYDKSNKAIYTDKTLVPNVSLAQAMGSYLVDTSGNVWAFITCPADNFLQLVRSLLPPGKSHVVDAELALLDLNDTYAKWYIVDLLASKRIRIHVPLYATATQAKSAVQRASDVV